MTMGMVSLGGYTRLTESGLSITEWKPVTGALPPVTEADWEREFGLYRESPEFRLRHASQLSLGDFQRIYWYEWAHRQLGRAIGLAWTVPMAYFCVRGRLRGRELAQAAAVCGGIGAQGALGWYMVKSGLEEPQVEGRAPSVSHYRLTAHLSSALALLGGMMWMGMNRLAPVPHDHAARLAAAEGLELVGNVVAQRRLASRLRALYALRRGGVRTLALVGLTAVWGSLMAGLDAGLVCSTFPTMDGALIPSEHLADPRLADRPWMNLIDNEWAVHFTHRVLATAAAASALITTSSAMRSRLLPLLPVRTRLAVFSIAGVAVLQYSLGILTAISSVVTDVAAAHQAGGMTLMAISLWLLHELRRLPK